MTAISFWAGQLPVVAPRAALAGPRSVDVCIVGGGFTGLWTAYELRRAAPELEVLVLEAEHVGFGASGRNGGWVSGVLAGSREGWAARRGGRQAVLDQERALHGTVDEIGAWSSARASPAAGARAARCTSRATPPSSRACTPRWPRTAPGGSARRTARCWTPGRPRPAFGSTRSGRPLHARTARGCSPARLVRGLAEAAERAGAEICEGTRVTAIEPGLARTARGDVRARFVVRATEGYTAGLAGLKRTAAAR